VWNSGRYSEEVVASLARVVRRLMEDGHRSKIAWFGYSGGGTLAVLLAPRFRETDAVVTIAANLDTAAWAAYAWGGDLSGSLNPATLAPLPSHVRQRHYAGGADRIVPPRLTASAASRLGADLIVVDDYDHVCCWEALWPGIIRDVAR
jgi:pimeloyl-ACP methyl ester carboxylesterase